MSRRRSLAIGALVAVLAGTSAPVIAADTYGDPAATPPTSSAAPAPATRPITLVPFEDPMFDIASVAPAGWSLIAAGTRARGLPPDDLALIALQTAAVGPALLWRALLPQLFIDEIPAVTDERQTPGFDWTIHDLETQVGDATVATSVALAEVDGSTSIVILQASPDEIAILREAVFLPALDAFRLTVPAPTSDPATLGYHVEEVTFTGGSADVRLAGTLTLPDADGPHAVVVLMSGSGPQDRNESTRPTATIEPFALIADALTRAGVGVLRYDDRGVGGSSGDYSSATIADLTGDGRAALDYLATRADVDPHRLGVLGHSEGAMYAATLAADDPRVAFAVVLAPPATDGITLLVEQSAAIARASGVPDTEVAAASEIHRRTCPAAIAGDHEGLESILLEATAAYWDRQTDAARAVLGSRDVFIERQLAAQLPTLTSESFRGICASEPTQDWSRVRVPVLALFGGRDVQVLPGSNAAALRDALGVAGNPDVSIVTIPDANHLFQASMTGAPQEYPTLADEFSADVLPAIVGWLTTRAGGGQQDAIALPAP